MTMYNYLFSSRSKISALTGVAISTLQQWENNRQDHVELLDFAAKSGIDKSILSDSAISLTAWIEQLGVSSIADTIPVAPRTRFRWESEKKLPVLKAMYLGLHVKTMEHIKDKCCIDIDSITDISQGELVALYLCRPNALISLVNASTLSHSSS